MTIGEGIKESRKDKGLSQQELGDMLGVSQAMIAQYENGKRTPKIDTLRKIAAALECEVSDIDESIIVIPIPKFKPTSEDIEQAKQNTKARRSADKLASGEDITAEEHQLIADYIEREKEGLPRLRESVKNFSNVIDKWGEHILVTKYRELNNNGKKEAVKRIDELTEIPRYTTQDPDDAPQD